MDLGIKGKVALITGGSRGIGKAAALEMAKEGCHVAITGRDEVALKATAEEIKSYGVKTLTIAADLEKAAEPVADEDNIDDLRRQMKDMQERLERMSKEPKKEE